MSVLCPTKPNQTAKTTGPFLCGGFPLISPENRDEGGANKKENKRAGVSDYVAFCAAAEKERTEGRQSDGLDMILLVDPMPPVTRNTIGMALSLDGGGNWLLPPSYYRISQSIGWWCEI